MKRRLTKTIVYLFIPENSIEEPAQAMGAGRPVPKPQEKVSLKAVFWAGMAISVALLLGKLS